jgi:uncharacterized pyridoxal phosphate-containing UPF0001 family protein
MTWWMTPNLQTALQVNTSAEEAKSGCEANECPALVRHIIQDCKRLNFTGLMTIGMRISVHK